MDAPTGASEPRAPAPRAWAVALAALVPVLGLGVALAAPAVAWRHLGTVKAAVAVAGTMLLAAGWALDRAGRGHVAARTRDGLLLSLGLLAGLCWWNLGLFHRDHYVHEWDTYHYYMGAKYFSEVGYARLYRCTVVADAQDGYFDPGRERTARDLETNRLVSAGELAAEPERCTAHFSPERWAAFKRDLALFRAQLGPRRWPDAQRDHGFNATPVWLMLGRGLASTGPVSRPRMLALALIDPGLLLGMWAVAWWGFGWRATSIALLYWGTNHPAFWGWTGGAFLRQDWLLFTVFGVALLRRGQAGAAGAAIGVAGLLRVFPWLLVGGLALKAAWEVWERRSLAPLVERRRFAAGFALALLVLVPAASMANGGWSVWPAFAANSAKHATTPAVNYVGLKSLVSYDHEQRVGRLAMHGLEDDVFRIWRAARARVLSERRLVLLAAVIALIALLALAVRRQPDWVAAVLGVGLIPVLGDVSCYYYSVLLAFGFIAMAHPPVGIALVGLAALTWWIQAFPWLNDTRYAAVSAAVLAFVALAGVCVWRSASAAIASSPAGSREG